MNNRDAFSSKAGFVLSCAGAAIGLGNIWMFPWRLGQYGGAAFLIPYLFFVYVLGTTGLMGEIGLGRWAKRGPAGAFDKALQTRGYRFGRLLGAYPVLAIWSVLFFYAIVAGWVLHYVFASVSGALHEAKDMTTYFDGLAGQPVSILWQILALTLALGIVILGFRKGIERANKVLMPALFVILLILVVRSVTLPGAVEGIRYLFTPDWSYLLKPITWGMALGQAFFSVGLGGGMIVYGSYVQRDMDIRATSLLVVTLDTVVALLSALLIIPAAFAFGLDPAAGPQLLFITLPEIFRAMPGGYVFGILFFLSVFFAALSSMFFSLEMAIEAAMDQFRWGRKKSVVLIVLVTFLCGVPLAINMGWFEGFIDLVTVYLLPSGAVLAAIMFFWLYGMENARREINFGAKRPVGPWWNPVAKYVYVGVAALIVWLQIAFGIG